MNSGKTDREIFGEKDKLRIKPENGRGGRPRINEDLALRLFQAGFSPSQVAGKIKCHVESARRAKRRFIAEGKLKDAKAEKVMTIVQADFDQECTIARGFSFLDWLTTKRKEPLKVFNFCQESWETIWDRPSLVLAMDDSTDYGDQLCLAWLKVFGIESEKSRLRNRLKLIRPLFTFLKRKDLLDEHLMTKADKAPRAIRKVPEITIVGFPEQTITFLEEFFTLNYEMGTANMLKVTSQMRTGDRKDNRGLMGIRLGTEYPSYLYMTSVEDWRLHVLEKKGEEWDVTWLPRLVRERLWEIYQTRKNGDYLFSFSVKKFRKAWDELSRKHFGRKLIPHDSRKISLTWLWLMGVPLEDATRLNVGWKDMQTAVDHYWDMGKVMKKSERKIYRKQIPEWYKDGLDEYQEENEFIAFIKKMYPEIWAQFQEAD